MVYLSPVCFLSFLTPCVFLPTITAWWLTTYMLIFIWSPPGHLQSLCLVNLERFFSFTICSAILRLLVGFVKYGKNFACLLHGAAFSKTWITALSELLLRHRTKAEEKDGVYFCCFVRKCLFIVKFGWKVSPTVLSI